MLESLVLMLAAVAALGLIVSINAMFSEKVRSFLGIDKRSAKIYFLISLAMFVVALIIAGS